MSGDGKCPDLYECRYGARMFPRPPTGKELIRKRLHLKLMVKVNLVISRSRSQNYSAAAVDDAIEEMRKARAAYRSVR